MSDQADKEVEALLPSSMDMHRVIETLDDYILFYRPAVAEALRKRDEQAAQQVSDVAYRMADDIIELKSQLAEANRHLETARSYMDCQLDGTEDEPRCGDCVVDLRAELAALKANPPDFLLDCPRCGSRMRNAEVKKKGII